MHPGSTARREGIPGRDEGTAGQWLVTQLTVVDAMQRRQSNHGLSLQASERRYVSVCGETTVAAARSNESDPTARLWGFLVRYREVSGRTKQTRCDRSGCSGTTVLIGRWFEHSVDVGGEL